MGAAGGGAGEGGEEAELWGEVSWERGEIGEGGGRTKRRKRRRKRRVRSWWVLGMVVGLWRVVVGGSCLWSGGKWLDGLYRVEGEVERARGGSWRDRFFEM